MFSRHMRQGWGYGRGGAFVNRRSVLALITLLLAPAPFALIPGEARAAGTTRILAFGDSLTAGFGLAPPDGFTAQLAARLKTDGYAVEVINAGVSGDTTSGGLERLDWSLADHPDMVLLELGANDMLRGIDPKLARANLDAMLARLTAAHLKVLLIGMKAPGNWGADYQKSFDGIYPALAAKYGVPLYPFYLDGVALNATLNQADGLHPNEAGVKVIVARMAPVIERMLGKQGG
jgi:acyl-CoA thioesterase-1